MQIEEYETQQELLHKGINLSDQFELLWQEIKAEENRHKGLHMKEEDEDDEDEMLEEIILLVFSSYLLYLNYIYLFL